MQKQCDKIKLTIIIQQKMKEKKGQKHNKKIKK